MTMKVLEMMNNANPGAFRDSQGRALPQDFRQRVATGKPLVGGTRSAKVKPRKAKHLNRDAD